MITNESAVHQLELNDKSGVIELLTKVLDNPNFSAFDLRICTKWATGSLMQNTKYYNIRIDLSFPNATNS